MKRMLSLCAAALCLTLALTPTALAADFEPAVPDAKVCYPTSIVRNDDGTELKKIYDLSPEDDPAGIPRSDFRQDGFHYHDNKAIDEKHILLWEQIVRVI